MSNVQSYSVDQYEALLAENKRLEERYRKLSNALGYDSEDRTITVAAKFESMESELTRLRAVRDAAQKCDIMGDVFIPIAIRKELDKALAACEDSEGGQ